MDTLNQALAPGRYELLFGALRVNGRSLCFPCDAGGRVELDALSDRARSNYLLARATLGYEFAWPVVRCTSTS